MMPDDNDKNQSKSSPRKMQKRVEKKEDGRLLIYYTFEETNGSKPDASTQAEATRK